MTPFDVYKLYVALKAHFTKAEYDFFEKNGKTKATRGSFRKRDDHYFFEQIAAKHEDPTDLFVSNFVAGKGPKAYVRDICSSEEAARTYARWRSRRSNIIYYTREQLSALGPLSEQVRVRVNNHPKLFRAYLEQRVDLDTLLIVDRALNIFQVWDENIREKSIWPHKYFLAKKYSPFLHVSDDAAKLLIDDLEY